MQDYAGLCETMQDYARRVVVVVVVVDVAVVVVVAVVADVAVVVVAVVVLVVVVVLVAMYFIKHEVALTFHANSRRPDQPRRFFRRPLCLILAKLRP